MELIDYKEKYENALENLKKIKDANKDNKELVDFINYKYPALIESEDERIKSAILGFLEGSNQKIIVPGISMNDAISWLEKQGEYVNFRNKIQIGDIVTRNEDGVLVNLSQFKRMVKQSEQKPTDKVKPKFEVGNRISNGINTYLIMEIEEDGWYVTNKGSKLSFYTADKYYHLV